MNYHDNEEEAEQEEEEQQGLSPAQQHNLERLRGKFPIGGGGTLYLLLRDEYDDSCTGEEIRVVNCFVSWSTGQIEVVDFLVASLTGDHIGHATWNRHVPGLVFTGSGYDPGDDLVAMLSRLLYDQEGLLTYRWL